ncbi:type II toxin-antitoxin system VapC family toxin [soil metagenome]
MTRRYLLDTTLLIDHGRGTREGAETLARLFEEAGDLYTCDIVTCEALSKGDADERRSIARLLDALEYVALDPDGARWAGEQRRTLAEAGRRHPTADALIAATAWRLGATVVTRNAADFVGFDAPVLGYGDPGPPAKVGTKRGSTR